MSNYSEIRPRLLRAIAQECDTAAREVGQLGDSLSGELLEGQDHIVALQSFDYLVQHITAQARLIERLSHGEADALKIATAIQDIPLPVVRNRLLAAIDMPVAVLASEDNVFWSDT